jgi:hypothetical protein
LAAVPWQDLNSAAELVELLCVPVELLGVLVESAEVLVELCDLPDPQPTINVASTSAPNAVALVLRHSVTRLPRRSGRARLYPPSAPLRARLSVDAARLGR